MDVRRVTALEGGIHLMTWIFSDGRAFGDDLRSFTTRIGVDWTDADNLRKADGGTVVLVKLIEQRSSSYGSHVFPWFEVGRNSIFLSNMIGTRAPAPLVEAAMSGYRRYLEDAGIRVAVRDSLQALLTSMSEGSQSEKAAALGKLLEMLRDQAVAQESEHRTESTVVTHINIINNSGLINVQSVLENVTQSIKSSQSLDLAKRSELVALFDQLKVELSKTPTSHAEHAEVLAEQAKEISDELKRSQPRNSALKVKGSGLVEAAKALGSVMPSALEIARQICEFIAKPPA